MQFEFEQHIGHGGVTMKYVAEIDDTAFARLQAEKISCGGELFGSITGDRLWCGASGNNQTVHDIEIYHINAQGKRITFPGMLTYVTHHLGEKLGVPVHVDTSRY